MIATIAENRTNTGLNLMTPEEYVESARIRSVADFDAKLMAAIDAEQEEKNKWSYLKVHPLWELYETICESVLDQNNCDTYDECEISDIYRYLKLRLGLETTKEPNELPSLEKKPHVAKLAESLAKFIKKEEASVFDQIRKMFVMTEQMAKDIIGLEEEAEAKIPLDKQFGEHVCRMVMRLLSNTIDPFKRYENLILLRDLISDVRRIGGKQYALVKNLQIEYMRYFPDECIDELKEQRRQHVLSLVEELRINGNEPAYVKQQWVLEALGYDKSERRRKSSRLNRLLSDRDRYKKGSKNVYYSILDCDDALKEMGVCDEATYENGSDKLLKIIKNNKHTPLSVSYLVLKGFQKSSRKPKKN